MVNKEQCIQERDCISVPFPDRCRKFCIERILSMATLEEKKLILGLKPATASAILNVYNNSAIEINSFDDLEKQLKPVHIEEILSKVSSINQYQLNYFQLPSYERNRIVELIRGLGIDEEGTSAGQRIT